MAEMPPVKVAVDLSGPLAYARTMRDHYVSLVADLERQLADAGLGPLRRACANCGHAGPLAVHDGAAHD